MQTAASLSTGHSCVPCCDMTRIRHWSRFSKGLYLRTMLHVTYVEAPYGAPLMLLVSGYRFCRPQRLCHSSVSSESQLRCVSTRPPAIEVPLHGGHWYEDRTELVSPRQTLNTTSSREGEGGRIRARNRSTSSRPGKRASESPSSSFQGNAITRAVAAGSSSRPPLSRLATGSRRLWLEDHFVGDRVQNCGYGCGHVRPVWTSEVPYMIECLMGSRFRVADQRIR